MILFVLACDGVAPVGPPDRGPDLTERLGADESRAGVVSDTSALFGGISAEGRAGDVKLYNDRVRFVVQQVGDSGYYVDYGGMIVDADLVRPVGQPGRDMLDELGPMVGLARVVDATSVKVLADGADGKAAIVRVEGKGAPLRLATGALENPDLVADIAMRVRVDYTLEPHSWSLKAETTVWNDDSADFIGQVGLVGIYSQEAADRYGPRTGLNDVDGSAVDWAAIHGMRNEGTLAILADTGKLEGGTLATILGSIAPVVSGFGPAGTIAAGEKASFVHWIGMGPDPATPSGEQLVRQGVASQTLTGTVTAGGSALAGAHVNVMDAAGAPLTMAITLADGTWTAMVPAGVTSLVVSGRGNGLTCDLPAGSGWISPYDQSTDGVLGTLQNGAIAIPFADGYGVATAASGDVDLTPPGFVHVTVTDGGPAVARLFFVDADSVVVDERVVHGRKDGTMGIGFIRDGELALPAEPGTYDVLVYRGVRDELSITRVTVVSGETVEVAAEIVPAYALEGVLTGDPHSHASPSGDGGVSMEERLLVMAGNGVDVHFGTDHDHVADYSPLLAPLGLEGRLYSVLADEVSPVLRGHFNAYPAMATTGANHGAPRWWQGYKDTAEIFGWMRDMVGDGVIQANHPVGNSGMFSRADINLSSGEIGKPDHYSPDFDAMELLNSGDYEEYLPYYLGLISRGKRVTPVGVSDSHSHTSGGVGLNVTFLHTNGTLAEFSSQALIDTMHAREVVVSHGPFIDVTIDGAWAPGTEVMGATTLDIVVRAPSWMPVETVSLIENDAVVDVQPCTGVAPTPCAVTFTLAPSQDAAYTVIAESTTLPMQWAHAGELAWAATSAVYVDVAGDGWTAPKAALF